MGPPQQTNKQTNKQRNKQKQNQAATTTTTTEECPGTKYINELCWGRNRQDSTCYQKTAA